MSNQSQYYVSFALNIPYNMSAASLQSSLNGINEFYKYGPTVTLEEYDATGALSNVSGEPVYQRVWTIEIARYRYRENATYQVDVTNLSNTDDPTITPTGEFTRIQEHSAPLGGYYYLTLNGVYASWSNDTTYSKSSNGTFNIYGTSYPESVRSYMMNTWKCNLIAVETTDNPFLPENGWTFLVTLRGCPVAPSPIALIIGDNTELTGGRDGTTPEIEISSLQASSSDLFVEPLSSEYLFTVADKPQVIASIDGIKSVCAGDCSFEFNSNIPTLTGANLDYASARLILSVSYPNANGVELSTTLVTIDGVPCTGHVGSIYNFNCTLPKNTDGSPKIRAGEYHPIVDIKKYGEAKPATNLAKIIVNLTLTSPAIPNIVGKAGGFPIIVKGKNLPHFYDPTTFAVTLCNKPAIVNFVNNTAMNITTPACTTASATLSATYNGKTASIFFNYDLAISEPIIQDLSISSASPVLKGSLRIYGTNFGTNKADLGVFLTDSTGFRVYQLNILEANNTQLLVKLSGGLTGAFKVSVVRAGYGSSTEATAGISNFKYEIVITSVSPSTAASRNGGTIITITGRNFSPDPLDNQVYIGDEMNWFCMVISATTTEIKCRTPPAHPAWINLNQNVVVVGRIIEESSCGGTCTLTYDNITTPTIVSPVTTQYSSSIGVNLVGQRLVHNSILPVVTVGETTANRISATDDSVSFLFPTLYKGTYDLNVYVDGIGYAEPTVEVSVYQSINGLFPSYGSVIGSIIELRGTGLTDPDSEEFSLTILRNSDSELVTPYEILTQTPTTLTFRLMTDGTSGTYLVKYGNSYSNYYYAQSSSTP